MSTYVSGADTNKFIRADLKKFWPDVQFSVVLNSYSGGASSRIQWVDGPTEKEVKELVADRYEGSTFDGQQDLASPQYGTHPETGERCHFATDYIFEERHYSAAFMDKIVAQVLADYHLKPHQISKRYEREYKGQTVVEYSRDFGPDVFMLGSEPIGVEIMKRARETSAVLIRKGGGKKQADGPTYAEWLPEPGEWRVYNSPYADRRVFQQYKSRGEKPLGAWWDRDPQCWVFPVPDLPDDIKALCKSLNGPLESPENGPESDVQASAEPDQPAKPAGDPDTAQKLRTLADNLQKTIDEKMNPATAQQNLTARRAGIIESMQADGRFLQLVQDKLYALADAHERGDIHPLLDGLTARAHIEYMLRHNDPPAPTDSKAKAFVRAGIATRDKYAEAQQLLLDLVHNPNAGQKTEADMIAELERDLAGRKIEGYFPTPVALAERMVQLADIQSGDYVLEPSAGSGRIADAVKKLSPGNIEVHCVEPVGALRKILAVKGHDVIGSDILDLDPERIRKIYNAIVMNPPFENGQDIEHVRYCFENLLAPGGTLVAIMGEGAFFRSDRKATAFREWYTEYGYDDPLPEGTFKESGTGVRTRLVLLTKPALPRARKREEGLFERASLSGPEPQPARMMDSQNAPPAPAAGKPQGQTLRIESPDAQVKITGLSADEIERVADEMTRDPDSVTWPEWFQPKKRRPYKIGDPRIF